jgi:hypothetical protein
MLTLIQANWAHRLPPELNTGFHHNCDVFTARWTECKDPGERAILLLPEEFRRRRALLGHQKHAHLGVKLAIKSHTVNTKWRRSAALARDIGALNTTIP